MSVDNLLVSPCARFPCDSQQCQDCCVGEHSINSGEYQDLVSNFFSPASPQPCIVQSFSQVQQGLAGLDCAASGVGLWGTFDPALKSNSNNLQMTYGPTPVLPANFVSIFISIPLCKGILNTFATGVNFNFSIGQGAHNDSDYAVPMNITDTFGEILYYADMSGLIP